MSIFDDRYYSECHAVFRGATDQSERMLADIQQVLQTEGADRILSVGCGAGLFEVPMLEQLLVDGISLQRFVGIDINRVACQLLSERLKNRLGSQIAWDVVIGRFEDYEPDGLFDVVIFNHSLEYLPGSPFTWIDKALDLLTPGGICVIYSPTRGGINGPYEKLASEAWGYAPRFNGDIEMALEENQVVYQVRNIEGSCSVELLARPEPDEDAVRLLSFLTQVDCRSASGKIRQELSDYFLGLSPGGNGRIPHPTVRFLIRANESTRPTPAQVHK